MIRLITKSFALVALVGAMTAFGTSAEAAFLTGEVNYTGDATFNITTNTVDFGDTDVESAFGDFAVLTPDGDPIVHEDPFVYSPFPVGGYTPLWLHVASGVTFDLTSINIVLENSNVLVLEGTGIFHAAGYDDTEGTWVMTVNQSKNTGSFSAVSAVPEPVSLSLLGLGLAGLAARRRQRA